MLDLRGQAWKPTCHHKMQFCAVKPNTCSTGLVQMRHVHRQACIDIERNLVAIFRRGGQIARGPVTCLARGSEAHFFSIGFFKFA